MLNYIDGLPKKLARVTSSGSIIEEIDGLRFVAIFPVVILHLNERFLHYSHLEFLFDPVFNSVSFFIGRGFIGVYVFFVISGFILALPFASHFINHTKAVSLKSYYWRRITRLEPPYIITMTIFFLGLVVIRNQDFTDLFPNFLASIFYLHNLIYFHWTPINPPAWTLEIEVQFYLIAPFLAGSIFFIKNKVSRRGLLGLLILILISIQTYFSLMETRVLMTILGQLQFFLIGLILADLYLCGWKTFKRSHEVFDILAFISFVALFYTWSWDYAFLNRILFCGFLFIFFFSAFNGHYIKIFLKNRWVNAIGGMCYTIYLIHLPLAELLVPYIARITYTGSYLINLSIQLIIYLPVLFVTSVIFYLLIEKPCMEKNWPRKFKERVMNTF